VNINLREQHMREDASLSDTIRRINREIDEAVREREENVSMLELI
jgi:hypothetical protein